MHDTTNPEGLTVRELGPPDGVLQCLHCGTTTDKDDADDGWLCDAGLVSCPDCPDHFPEQ